MNEIIVYKDELGYNAVLDSYDGAPDAVGPDSYIGNGATELSARTDLEEQLSAYAAEEAAERGEWEYEQRRDRRMGS